MADYHLNPKMYGNWLLILQLILMGFQATRMFTFAISKKYQKSTLSNVVWIMDIYCSFVISRASLPFKREKGRYIFETKEILE